MVQLPIDRMSEGIFSVFKREFLDRGLLSEEALREIRELFGVGSPDTGYVNCDEAHAHDYRCVYHKDPRTGIVDRLLNEVLHYQNLIGQIREMAKTD